VVNDRVRVPRRERELLEAILVNCDRHGPRSQNRDGHADFRAYLRGRVAWVAQHDERDGQRMRELFERIVWP
jgi:RNA-directed DNA polymerase